MLDRESACNRVFLARRFVLFGADGVGLRFKPVLSRARRYHTDHADVGAGLVGAAIGQR